MPDLLHPFFAEVAKSLARALRKTGYFLIIASSEEDPEIEEQEVEHMVARGLDGLVVAAATTSRALFDRLDKVRQPYVLIDRSFAGLSANFVGVDDVSAGSLATQHLIDRGCVRIAHICGRDDSTGMQRLEGTGVPWVPRVGTCRRNTSSKGRPWTRRAGGKVKRQ